jgi:hypothetical protein
VPASRWIMGPETLKVVYQAFDDAWDKIRHYYGSDHKIIDAGRLKLAEAIIAVARDDSRDPELIKRLALQLMRLDA